MPNCEHKNTHYLEEEWPDDTAIEVCDKCGMSRSHWEQGESSWIMVEDLAQARKELEEARINVVKNIWLI